MNKAYDIDYHTLRVECNTNVSSIYFKELHIDTDLTVNDIIIIIENGKIKTSNSNAVNEFVKELPPNGDVIAELE